MAYQLFRQSGATSESFISLTKEGFRLSVGFVRRYGLERARTARLYFDAKRRTIAFHIPTGVAPSEGARALKRHDGGFVVRAEGFFKAHGLDPALYGGRYEPRVVKDRVLKRLFVITPRRQGARGSTGLKTRRAAA